MRKGVDHCFTSGPNVCWTLLFFPSLTSYRVQLVWPAERLERGYIVLGSVASCFRNGKMELHYKS